MIMLSSAVSSTLNACAVSEESGSEMLVAHRGTDGQGRLVAAITGVILGSIQRVRRLGAQHVEEELLLVYGDPTASPIVVGDDVQWKSIWRAIATSPAGPGNVSPNIVLRLGAELCVPWRQILDELRKPNECRPIVVVTRVAAKIQGSDEELRVLFTFAELKCVVSFHGILIHDPLLDFHRELVVPAQVAWRPFPLGVVGARIASGGGADRVRNSLGHRRLCFRLC